MIEKHANYRRMTPEQKKEHIRIMKREWDRANRVKYSCPKSRTKPAKPYKKNKGNFVIIFE